uniref:Uncharacterized protein n=1 Tax=Ananas comosus var. bracteatus TaxID=296719 RepID=A0A6V7QW97_ANACO
MPMPMPILEYPTHGFPFPPTLTNFPVDGNIGGGSGGGDGNDNSSNNNDNNDNGVGGGEYGRIQEVQENSRLLFPFEELKPVGGPSSTTTGSNNSDHEQFEHNRGQGVDPSPGFGVVSWVEEDHGLSMSCLINPTKILLDMKALERSSKEENN